MNTQISEENSEKELIDLCNESHVTLSDLRLFKEEKELKIAMRQQVKVFQLAPKRLPDQ